MSFREIGPAVGLDESTVRREPAVRAVKGFAVHASTRNLDSCGVLPETALARIKEIRQEGEYVLNLVGATLNRDYNLSPADRNDLLETIKEISDEMIGYITEMETPAS
jgi:hydrogenase maturation factor